MLLQFRNILAVIGAINLAVKAFDLYQKNEHKKRKLQEYKDDQDN